MKKLMLALAIIAGTASPMLASRCGAPPAPPGGCTNPQCVCDSRGNCHYIYDC